jgi:hypothetical protein
MSVAGSANAGKGAASESGGALAAGGATQGPNGGASGRATTPNAGAGDTAGTQGAAGYSTTSVGGSGAQAGQGAQAGDQSGARGGAAGNSPSAGGEAGNSAGMAGDAGSRTDVLDPNLPIPSYDCRTDTGHDCVSVAGTVDGMSIDLSGDTEPCGAGGVHAGKWVIGCDRLGSGKAAVDVQLDVPIMKAGSFSGSMAGPGDARFADFYFTIGTTSPTGGTNTVALFADNMLGAQIEGTVVADDTFPDYPYRIVSGTLHGVWGPPDDSCRSYASTTCATAELNITFRSKTQYGTCLSASECTPPKTCDSVGAYCVSQ